MARGKKRTERLRQHLVAILETRDEPMTARDLSNVLESQTRLRCGVNTIPNVFRPLISTYKIRRVKPVGMKIYTYELIYKVDLDGFMKWTDEPQVMRAFNNWVTNANGNLGEFVREIMSHIPKNDSSMLFITFAKFSHLYTDHRNRNPEEELSLSFHRSLNTLMEEESTRNMFSRMAQAAANAAVGAEK